MSLFDADAGPARCKLILAYDGTGFRGSAATPGMRTVEAVLVKAMERVLRHPVDLTFAGRTDAGVHAWGQVLNFDADPGLDPWRLQGSLNSMLGPEIVVRSAELVDPRFDARHSAKWRSYRYTIVNRPVPDPFLARYAWWVPQTLDLAALRMGADPFVGEHDFAAFCRQRPEGKTTVRRVIHSKWVELPDDVLRYEITASAFCWQMVRSIVGTLVDVGMGKLRPGDLMGIVRGRDRGAAGQLAPPHGLCLWEVGY